MDKLKYLAAILIGIAGVGLQQSQAQLLDPQQFLTNAGIGNPSCEISWDLESGLTFDNLVKDISRATVFGSPGGQSVPDGGATVMLLGAALGASGMVRCYFFKS